MKPSIPSCTQKHTDFHLLFCTTFSLALEWDMRYVDDWRDGWWFVHVLGTKQYSNYAEHTRPTCKNVARLGRDVEMCSGKEEGNGWMREATEKVQSVQSCYGGLHQAYQTHNVAIPVFFSFHRTIRKIPCERKISRSAKLGSSSWWYFLDINIYAHSFVHSCLWQSATMMMIWIWCHFNNLKRKMSTKI